MTTSHLRLIEVDDADALHYPQADDADDTLAGCTCGWAMTLNDPLMRGWHWTGHAHSAGVSLERMRAIQTTAGEVFAVPEPRLLPCEEDC